jgi:hypothetical protein
VDPIAVTARFEAQGKIVPLSFIWQSRTFRIDSLGRQWQGKDGFHIMAMTPGNRAHHLLFMPEKGIWYLVRGDDTPTIPII